MIGWVVAAVFILVGSLVIDAIFPKETPKEEPVILPVREKDQTAESFEQVEPMSVEELQEIWDRS